MQAFWQLYLANVKEFVRDRMAMFWTLAFPVFFIAIFGLIFSNDTGATFDIGLAVEDAGPVGQALTQTLTQLDVFETTLGTRADLLAQLRAGDLRVVVVVPPDVSRTVAAGQPATIQVHYDPSNQTTANVVLSIINDIVAGIDRSLTETPALLHVEPISVASERLGQIDFLLPGILAMALMQLGLFGTAPALVQLRETHVLRRLGATPLPRLTLLASQVLHRVTIGAAQTLIIVAVGTLVFKVNIVGNLGLLAGFVLLGALMFVALGYLLSGLAKSQDSVNGLTQLLNFPMMFLSGVFFPVDFMPAWIRPVVNLLPLTYLADALRQIMVGAPPTYPLGVDFAVLAGWLVVCALLAVRFFKWE